MRLDYGVLCLTCFNTGKCREVDVTQVEIVGQPFKSTIFTAIRENFCTCDRGQKLEAEHHALDTRSPQ